MIFWMILAVLLVIGSYGMSYWYKRSAKSVWKWTVSFVSFMVAIIIFISSTICYFEYKHFTIEYEIIRETYENYKFEIDAITKVIDIYEANEKLAGYKASKELWGFASVVPDSVYDIKPIGLE